MEHPLLYCLDTVMVDVIMKVDHIPQKGGDVLADDRLFTTGGGYNAMSAASRCGLQAVYVGTLGTGPFSDLAMESLKRDGIEAPLPHSITLDAGYCVTLVEPSGERTFITAAGSESELNANHLTMVHPQGGDYVLVSGYNVMYEPQAEALLLWLEGLGAEVVVAFDPAIRIADIPPKNLERMLSRTNWLLCNEDEARYLTKKSDMTEVVGQLAVLCSHAVLRVGAEGCWVIEGSSVTRVSGFPVKVIDTTGAGDTHNGIFLAELALGHTPVEAAEIANAGAALATEHLGPATSPSLEAIKTWLATHDRAQ
jgi:sugar/nucleoside kinase (ribokinase family)